MTRKLVVEAIGAFFLFFTIGQVVLEPGAGALAPVAIGVVLMVMVYAGGHISGGHYNPAVSLAVYLRGKATALEFGAYAAAQVVAAVLAAVLVQYLKGGIEAPPVVIDAVPALLAEFLFTFALCYVVLSTATARGNAGNSFFGFAIGGTVLVGAFAVGGISGGAFNPAVAVGLVTLGLVEGADVWVHLLAELAGGAGAALVFNVLQLGGDKPTTATAAAQAQLETPAST